MERHYRKYIGTLRRITGGRTASRTGLLSETTENMSPQQHYSVAKRDRDHVDLYALSNRHMGDPALKVSNISHSLALVC